MFPRWLHGEFTEIHGGANSLPTTPIGNLRILDLKDKFGPDFNVP